MKFRFLFFIALWLIPWLGVASVGQFTLVTGKVLVERSGQSLSAETGMALEQKDFVVTRSGGRAQVRFEDDTVITLNGLTRFGISEFLYEEANQPDEAEFNVAEGAFKAITGKIGEKSPDRFKVKTRTATIGIRGTIFMAKILPERETFATLDGQIFVTEDQTGGLVEIPSGQFVNVFPGLPPAPPQPLMDAVLDDMNSEPVPGASEDGNASPPGAPPSGPDNPTDGDVNIDPEPLPDAPAPMGQQNIPVSAEGGFTPLDVVPEVVSQAQQSQTEEVSKVEQPTAPPENFNQNQGEWQFNEEQFTYEWLAYDQPSEPTEPEAGYSEDEGDWVFNEETWEYEWEEAPAPAPAPAPTPSPSPSPQPDPEPNAGREQSMQGVYVKTIDPTGSATSDGTRAVDWSKGYLLSDNTLKDGVDGTGTELTYEQQICEVECASITQILAREWLFSLPEAKGSYTGFDEYTQSKTFWDYEGNEAATVDVKVYVDSMQEFFITHYKGGRINYSEAFGVPTLVGKKPGAGIVRYQSPVDNEQVVVNFSNNQLMSFSLDQTNFQDVSIRYGEVDSQDNLSLIVHESEYVKSSSFAPTKITTSSTVPVAEDASLLYGQEAQGMVIVTEESQSGTPILVGTTAQVERNLFSGFKDTSFNSVDNNDGNPALALFGLANSRLTGDDYGEISINMTKSDGWVSATEIDISQTTNTAMTYLFNDTGGDYANGAYIHDDRFVTTSSSNFDVIGSVDAWIAAVDDEGIVDNEFVSWGYWGAGEPSGVSRQPVLPSPWVAGKQASAAATYLDGLTPDVTYSYSGSLMGMTTDTFNGTVYAIDEGGTVDLGFDFGPSGDAFTSAQLTFSSNNNDWNVSLGSGPNTVVSDASGHKVFEGTLTGDAGATTGSLKGLFYGDHAQAIGGRFEANKGSLNALGVFEGKRPLEP